MHFHFRSVIQAHTSEHRRAQPKIADRKRKRSATGDEQSLSVTPKSRGASKSREHHRRYYEKDVKTLLKVAHILHYCSIAILGIFVIQVRCLFHRGRHAKLFGWAKSPPPLPVPFPIYPLPFLPQINSLSPSPPPFLAFPVPSLPLEVGPLNTARGPGESL